MVDPECPLTELPASMCACRNHRGGSVIAADGIELDGRPFEAAYSGVCERCDRGIRPGDMIRRIVDSAGYAHVRCPR